MGNAIDIAVVVACVGLLFLMFKNRKRLLGSRPVRTRKTTGLREPRDSTGAGGGGNAKDAGAEGD
jgi:hypothetical protein